MGLQGRVDPSFLSLTRARVCSILTDKMAFGQLIRQAGIVVMTLSLTGCELISALQVKEDKPVEFSRQQHYQCASGEHIMISYSQSGDSAMLLYSGQTQVLPKVASETGMRFQGGQWAWQLEGNKGELFYDHQQQAKERCSRVDESKGGSSTLVSGNIILPASLPSIDRAVLDLRLYKYEPFAADKRAEMVDWVQSRAFVHQQGSSTERPFQIGTQEPHDPQMGYYLTLYLLENGHRTHIGQCQHNKKGLCKVLTQNQPEEVEVVFKKLGL